MGWRVANKGGGYCPKKAFPFELKGYASAGGITHFPTRHPSDNDRTYASVANVDEFAAARRRRVPKRADDESSTSGQAASRAGTAGGGDSSSIRSRGARACTRRASGISTRGARLSMLRYSFSRVFLAMKGQLAQSQVPSAPGAARKVLPGAAFSI